MYPDSPWRSYQSCGPKSQGRAADLSKRGSWLSRESKNYKGLVCFRESPLLRFIDSLKPLPVGIHYINKLQRSLIFSSIRGLNLRGPFLLYLVAIPIALLVFLKLFEPKAIEKTSASGKNLPRKTLLPLLIITLAVGVFFYTVIVSLGDILLLVEEVSPAQIGLIGAAVNLGVMIAASSFIKLKGNSSGPRLLAIGFSLFSIGYVGMGVSSSIAGSVTAAIITSLGAGFLLPCMLAWVMSILEAGDRGKGTGLWTGMFFLGQFVAPLVVVALSGPLAGLSNVLVFYGITAAVLMIAALWASRGAEPLRQNT